MAKKTPTEMTDFQKTVALVATEIYVSKINACYAGRETFSSDEKLKTESVATAKEIVARVVERTEAGE